MFELDKYANTVLTAYEVYKMEQGYRWKGTEGDTWVKS